jgi:predicted RNA methylase
MKRHQHAEELLKLDRLNDDQRQEVLDNWQEGASHMNGASAAFFTPSGLALDLALMAGCNGYSPERAPLKVLDLCAGIGCLGLAAWWRCSRNADVTCVEINPDYVAVGRKLFPEANWICADVDDLPREVARGGFDVVLANPPFGNMAKIKGPRFSGEDALALVDIASDLADHGGFILPSGSLPFRYSGTSYYQEITSAKYDRFHKATGVELTCESIDCGYYADEWHGVRPQVEAVTCYFNELQEARRPTPQPQPELFGLPLFAAAA